jgi:hypothetical protein
MRYLPKPPVLAFSTKSQQRLVTSSISNMSDNTATNQSQSAAAKKAEESATAVASPNIPAEDASKTEQDGEQPQQTGSGPKALRSHYRGMPNQWEKNLRE